MPLLPPRPLTALDAELRALCDVIAGASRELTEVRRRQAELVDMEAALVVALEVRMRRVDDLLDLRCEIAGTDQSGGGPVPGVTPSSTGGVPVGVGVSSTGATDR